MQMVAGANTKYIYLIVNISESIIDMSQETNPNVPFYNYIYGLILNNPEV